MTEQDQKFYTDAVKGTTYSHLRVLSANLGRSVNHKILSSLQQKIQHEKNQKQKHEITKVLVLQLNICNSHTICSEKPCMSKAEENTFKLHSLQVNRKLKQT